MRKFILWNYGKSSSFDFDSNNIVITDIQGLGIDYSPTLLNNIVTNYERKYADIKFKINVGVDANAYTKFSTLASFVAANGNFNFILEYQFNGNTYFCDVWVSTISKSEKTRYNILTETVVLKRVSEWYTIINGTIQMIPTYLNIENPLFDEMPVIIYAEFTTNGHVYIGLYNSGGGSSISSVCVLGEAGDVITIYSDIKKVTCTNNGVVTNGYNKILRQEDTFMMVPKGNYQLGIYNLSGTVSVSCFYRKPVLG